MNVYIADMISCENDSVLHRHRISWALEWIIAMPKEETTGTPKVTHRKETSEAIYLLRALLSEKKNDCKYAYQQITNPVLQHNEQITAPKQDTGGVSYEHALRNANIDTQA